MPSPSPQSPDAPALPRRAPESPGAPYPTSGLFSQEDEQNTRLQQFKEGGACFGARFEGTGHRGGKGAAPSRWGRRVARARGGCSRGICGQEAR